MDEAGSASNYALLAKTRTGWESAAKVIAADIANFAGAESGRRLRSEGIAF